MPVFISELKLTNILSFGPEGETIPLGPLNVLIGANGSGKSNIISAISLLQAAPGDIRRPLLSGGSREDWIWKGSPEVVQDLWVHAIFHRSQGLPSGTLQAAHQSGVSASVSYDAQFFGRGDPAESLVLWEELKAMDDHHAGRCLYRTTDDNAAEYGAAFLVPTNWRSKIDRKIVYDEDIDTGQSVFSQRGEAARHPEIAWIGRLLKKVRVYREFDTSASSALRNGAKADVDGTFLDEGGSNLSVVYSRFQRDPQVMRRILKELNSFCGDFTHFFVEVFGGHTQLHLQEESWTTPASRLSDGTLRYLCLLAILLHPSPPPLICIEEPELGLHPDMMHKLAALLIDASTRTQLIITTHSDVLVDALHDTPESIVVCEKHDGRTKVKRLDPEHLKPWLEEYRLGTLWRRGDIGGNRW